jgi:transcriptional regulator with XRE-family HTH domain
MAERQARRFTRDLTPEEQERMKQYREQIACELPDLVMRDRMRKEAAEELTLSGELRRAVHANDLDIIALAARTGITPLLLDEFLTGERTLRSDVLDRLAKVLGYDLHRVS